jgi:NitT/TauT family transport system ATP-binding protein
VSSAIGVEIRDLGKSYPGARHTGPTLALQHVDLDIRPGEFLALVGPSGCGKSTLLLLIAGLTRPSSGSLRVDGAPVTGPGADRGVMFQEYALLPWKTVWQNVEFGPRYGPLRHTLSAAERRRRVAETLDLVGLTGQAGKYPRELSGGMKQRCALARLLANEPNMLLLDEPLAAVDAQTRQILQGELLRIWTASTTATQRRTVLLVTHAIDEAVFMADRVAVMSARPGTIREIVPIDLPRPRTDAQRRSAAFGALVERIWSSIKPDAYRASVDGLELAADTAGVLPGRVAGAK